MLTGTDRVRAVRLLREADLLEQVLPELGSLLAHEHQRIGPSAWQRAMGVLGRLTEPPFAAALAALIQPCVAPPQTAGHLLQRIAHRLKLTNAERKDAEFLLKHQSLVRQARRLPWPRLQRILIQPHAAELVEFSSAVAQAWGEDTTDVDYCRDKLALPAAVLNPPPLITGADLRAIDLQPGPAFGRVLEAVRDAQLNHEIDDKPGALELARRLYEESA
jgi:hypothetical protein